MLSTFDLGHNQSEVRGRSGTLSGSLTELLRLDIRYLVRGRHRGDSVASLSPSMVARLEREWPEDYVSWKKRALDHDWVHMWADRWHPQQAGRLENAAKAPVRK